MPGAGTSSSKVQRAAMRAMDALVRPRVLLAAPLLAWGAWYWYASRTTRVYEEAGDKVQAWFNPR
jgi:hypothetical protein